MKNTARPALSVQIFQALRCTHTMAATLESRELLRAVRQLDAPDGLSDMELEEVRIALRNGRGTLANVLAYPPRRAEDRVAVQGHVVELRQGRTVRLGALDVDNALMLRYDEYPGEMEATREARGGGCNYPTMGASKQRMAANCGMSVHVVERLGGVAIVRVRRQKVFFSLAYFKGI